MKIVQAELGDVPQLYELQLLAFESEAEMIGSRDVPALQEQRSLKMKAFYMSYMGFPVAGATLPVIACLLLGIYSGNAIVICASIILGIGHIGIHLMHKKFNV